MTEPTREQNIQGLRELADFLTAHPTIPFHKHQFNEFIDTRDEWDAARDAAGPAMITVKDDEFFVLRKVFTGGIRLDVNVERAREDDDTIPDHLTTSR